MKTYRITLNGQTRDTPEHKEIIKDCPSDTWDKDYTISRFVYADSIEEAREQAEVVCANLTEEGTSGKYQKSFTATYTIDRVDLIGDIVYDKRKTICRTFIIDGNTGFSVNFHKSCKWNPLDTVFYFFKIIPKPVSVTSYTSEEYDQINAPVARAFVDKWERVRNTKLGTMEYESFAKDVETLEAAYPTFIKSNNYNAELKLIRKYIRESKKNA